MSTATKEILVEVTSGSKLQAAKNAADALVKEMLEANLGRPLKKPKDEDDDFYSDSSDEEVDEADELRPKTLLVEQAKVVDAEEKLKVVYPSKADLQFTAINVKRL